MKYSAIKPRALLSKAPPPSTEKPPSRRQEIGDRVCCAGFIVAGLLGYGFAWLMISGMR